LSVFVMLVAWLKFFNVFCSSCCWRGQSSGLRWKEARGWFS
jgi:hypothetical protein